MSQPFKPGVKPPTPTPQARIIGRVSQAPAPSPQQQPAAQPKPPGPKQTPSPRGPHFLQLLADRRVTLHTRHGEEMSGHLTGYHDGLLCLEDATVPGKPQLTFILVDRSSLSYIYALPDES